MSIRLHTGLPGHGKTLMTLDKVHQWATKEGREVYYSGIKDLKLSWQEIDPKNWKSCPPNSIVVIDEAQFTFGKVGKADEIPHIADLTVHRHGGLDLVLITQHPMLLDPFVRRLIDKHIHVVRRWGSQAATLHEWMAVRTNCELPAARKDSSKSPYKYPKQVYELYKSAETHTVRRAIPKQFFQLAAILFLVLGLGFYIYSDLHKRSSKPAQEQTDAPLAGAPNKMQSSATAIPNPQADAERYVFEHTPRVTGLPFTAPRYDEITKPTTAPIPASCIQLPDGRCWCWSQQGTRLDVEASLCRHIVEGGFFRDFDDRGGDPRADRDRANGGGNQRPSAQESGRPKDTASPAAAAVSFSQVSPETKMSTALILANASMSSTPNNRGFSAISLGGQ